MRKLFLVTSLLALASGCTQVVNVSYSDFKPNNAIAGISDGITTKVLVQPPAKGNQEVYVQNGLVVVGLQNSWQVDLNQALPAAVRDVFKQTYSEIVVGHTCDDCGLIVRPKVTEVEVGKIAMQATVSLEIGVYDAYGREVTRINSTGNSAYVDTLRLTTGVASYFVPLLGNAVGTTVIGESVKDAFDEALAQIDEKVSYEANSGVLARNWLPKADKFNRKIGKHQYTAEQIAKTAGCDMNSDGLHLTAEEYYSETYTASCWGKPQFAITCEFGRCLLDDTGQELASRKP